MSETPREVPQHEVHQRAKDEWMRKFEGAMLVKTSDIGSPTMRHFHRRAFDHVGRNCHFITVFGRILLGEDRISEAEEAVTKRLDDVTKAIERKIRPMEAMIAEAALSEEEKAVAFNRIEAVKSDIVIPAQKKFLNTILLGDKYLVLVNLLWLNGVLDNKAKSRAELELKQLLRSIPSTTRKMRIYLQTKLREEASKAGASAAVKNVLREAEADTSGTTDVESEEEAAETNIALAA